MKNKLWKKVTAGMACTTLLFSNTLIYQGNMMVQAEETEEGIVIEDTFTDEAFKSYVQKEADLDENGKLSEAELGVISTMDVSQLGIKEMTGIEYFTSLTELRCNDNSISSLNLQNNRKLTKLYCNNNKMGSLNVSNNTELTILECSDNLLGVLSIENCGLLKELYCRNNLLENLNISYASKLQILDCGNNTRMTVLNTGSNAVLKEVYCDGTAIATLYFKNNPSLEKVICEGTGLTALDLTANTNLTLLDCSDNALTELDLSNVERLKEVDCSNNQIQELNVKRSSALTSLDCRNNKIQNLDVTANSRLTSLLCSNNELLCLDISSVKGLTTFFCENNERTIESPVLELGQLEGFEEEKVSELANATIEDGMLRFVNTSLPITYKYQISEGNTVVFTVLTTGTFKSMATVNVENLAEQTYCGSEIKPEIKAVYGSEELKEGKDYTVSYSNNIEAGTATVTLKGKGEFDGSVTETFRINPEDIANTDMVEIRNQVYTGQAVTPQLDISFGGIALVYGKDYTTNYSNNYNIGVASVEITGKGNFKGTITKNFTIEEKHIGRAAMQAIPNQVYNGSEIKPEVIMEDGSSLLVKGKDYSYTYENNINAGTAKIHISGLGNYGKQAEETFIIDPKPINNLEVEKIPDYDYSGFEITPDISVYDSEIDTALIENEDYVVEYENNQNAGTATVTIYGKGNYKGQIVKEFKINVRDSANVSVEKIASQIYTAREIKPDIIIRDGAYRLQQGIDYTVAYTENKNIGIAKVELVFKGNYQGIIKTEFEILPRDVAYVDITKIEDQYYSGMEIIPEFQLNHDTTVLVPDEDYMVTYEENIEIGKGKIILTGLGNYCNSRVEEFNIVPRPIEKTDIVCEETFVYSGTAYEPKPIITLNGNSLVEGIDYQVAYKNNVNAGKGVIIVEGLGNYCDKTEVTFDIYPKDITGIAVNEVASQIYNGNELKPGVTAKDGNIPMTPVKDYTLSYKDNVNAGKGVIIIEGKGNYTGTKEVTFKIQPKSFKGVIISPVKAQNYTGSAIKPNLTLKDGGKKLKLDSDFNVKFSKNKKVGTAKAVITGKGNYTGSLTTSFTIKQASIKKAEVVMENSVAYTGKAVEPSVKVYFGGKQLKAKRDYVVSYKNNVNVGKGAVIIEGKGNLKGTKTVSFDIGAKAPSMKKLSTKTRTFTVKWKTVSGVSGYEVQYSKNKDFTTGVRSKKISGEKKNTWKSGKLAKGSKYYVRVRAYTKIKGKKVYGGYSSTKSIKIK